jgi:hypothetical protein
VYHDRFQRSIPPRTPARLVSLFDNPLLLQRGLPGAGAVPPGALPMLQQLLGNVRLALLAGLHSIFVMGAILMVVAVAANFFLREVPLRKKHHASVAAGEP